MDAIEKWLKSLRLHKYTHLFKSLTYDQMLNLDESYLIKQEVTKGARNKMLVSVKKLNLRQERLINMIDDLNQDNISMKEALTVLKDMLITPIPAPKESPLATSLSSVSSTPSTTNTATTPSTISTTTPSSYAAPTPSKSPSSTLINNYLDQSRLTYLFTETLEKVAHRLIESAGMEDNACHGIMAAIVDECLKHNSFTKEQKATVASFRQYFAKDQKAKVASNFRMRPQTYNHHHHHTHSHHHHQQQQQMRLQLELQQQQQQQQQHQQQPQHQQQQQQNHQQQQQLIQKFQRNQYHYLSNKSNGPISSSSLSASLSTLSSDEEELIYREYSLLGPGLTFELPCLRAAAEKRRVGTLHL